LVAAFVVRAHPERGEDRDRSSPWHRGHFSAPDSRDPALGALQWREWAPTGGLVPPAGTHRGMLRPLVTRAPAIRPAPSVRARPGHEPGRAEVRPRDSVAARPPMTSR
jgi:hypothetical protein